MLKDNWPVDKHENKHQQGTISHIPLWDSDPTDGRGRRTNHWQFGTSQNSCYK